MNIRVRLFAVARQLADAAQVEVELPEGATVGDLRRALAGQVPTLADWLPCIVFAVDASYAREDVVLRPTSDVACIPPVSGG